MKKYAVSALFLLFATGSSLLAQESTVLSEKKEHRNEFGKGKHKVMSAEERTNFIAKEIGLTDAEKVKVQALFIKQDEKREKHRLELEQARLKEMTKMAEERKSQDAELEKIIGKEKFQKVIAKRAEMEAKMKEHRALRENKGVYANDSTSHRKRKNRSGVTE
jgi:periplasmic protein CpxP/Spy